RRQAAAGDAANPRVEPRVPRLETVARPLQARTRGLDRRADAFSRGDDNLVPAGNERGDQRQHRVEMTGLRDARDEDLHAASVPAAAAAGKMVGRTYLERGRPVVVLIRWAGKGPRNVL